MYNIPTKVIIEFAWNLGMDNANLIMVTLRIYLKLCKILLISIQSFEGH